MWQIKTKPPPSLACLPHCIYLWSQLESSGTRGWMEFVEMKAGTQGGGKDGEGEQWGRECDGYHQGSAGPPRMHPELRSAGWDSHSEGLVSLWCLWHGWQMSLLLRSLTHMWDLREGHILKGLSLQNISETFSMVWFIHHPTEANLSFPNGKDNTGLVILKPHTLQLRLKQHSHYLKSQC